VNEGVVLEGDGAALTTGRIEPEPGSVARPSPQLEPRGPVATDARARDGIGEVHRARVNRVALFTDHADDMIAVAGRRRRNADEDVAAVGR